MILLDSKLDLWIKENIPRYMDEGKLPGFSIAVVKEEEISFKSALLLCVAKGENIMLFVPLLIIAKLTLH